MRRFVSALIVVVVVVAGSLVGLRVLRANHKPQAPTYSLAKAQYGPLVVDVSGSGTVQAAQSVNVAAQQSGTVTSVPVQVGSKVKAGQVLAYVSDPEGNLKSSLLSAEAQLASDQSNLNQLVSPTPPTQAQIQADQQRVQVDQTKIQTDQQNIQNLTVAAPRSGVISAVNVGVGQSVNQNTPLFTIVQPDQVDVQASVPEIDLANVYVGEGVQVWTQNQGVMQAAVQTIGVTSSGSGRQGALYPVTLTIEKPPTGMRAGMQATVNFTQFYYSTTGTVSFANALSVAAQVSGTVESIKHQEGETVQSGDTVLTLSNSSLATQLSADQAQLATDQAALQQLQNPTPPQPGQVAALKARIAVDQQNVARAKLAQTQLNIVSPIDGIVTAVNVQAGDDVNQGGGVSNANTGNTGNSTGTSSGLFAVENPNSLQVLVSISEISISQVKPGQSVTLIADALPGQTFQGTVALISPSGTESQGVSTFNVIIDVPNPGGLLSGMSSSVAIHVASVQHALLVPVEAVTGVGNQATVEVLENGKPTVKHVVVGLSNDVAAQIVSGLSAGTPVIAATASTGTNFGGGRGGVAVPGGAVRGLNGGFGGKGNPGGGSRGGARGGSRGG